jgi:hypothetical protein
MCDNTYRVEKLLVLSSMQRKTHWGTDEAQTEN